MATRFGSYSTHTDKIVCPHCGKTGHILWEDVCSPDGNRKEMIRIEVNFYERLARKPPYAIELVCDDCGAAQAE